MSHKIEEMFASKLNDSKGGKRPLSDESSTNQSDSKRPEISEKSNLDSSLNSMTSVFEEDFAIPDDAPFWVPLLFRSLDNVKYEICNLATKVDDQQTEFLAKFDE